MKIEMIRDILMWCSIFNAGLLIFTFLIVTICRPLVYKAHSKWIAITESQFNAIWYSLIMFLRSWFSFLISSRLLR